jgi:hypothetical protein
MKSTLNGGRVAGLLTAGVLLAGLCGPVMAGCVSVNVDGDGWSQTVKKEREFEAPAAMDKPVIVKARNGSVNVKQGGGADVKIKAEVRAKTEERLAEVKLRANRKASGELVIDAEWPGGKPQDNEGVSFEIELPGASELNVDTSNGQITVQGLACGLKLDTSNGPVRVKDHQGEIEIDTSNGPVEVVDATGKVKVNTSNGAIKMSLAAANAGPVSLDTSNGSIVLTVGQAFAGRLTADTSNGGVTLPEGVKVIKKGKTSATIEFATSGGESVLDTSNGSITIKRRD